MAHLEINKICHIMISWICVLAMYVNEHAANQTLNLKIRNILVYSSFLEEKQWTSLLKVHTFLKKKTSMLH